MARHVDPDDTSFRRSLLRAAGGGLAALVLTFGVTAVLTRTGQIGEGGGPAMIQTASPSAVPTVAAVPETELPTPEPEPEPEPTQPAPVTPAPTPAEVTENPVTGVTVQVLEQVGAEAQAAQAAGVLRRLGYDVVAVNITDRQVDTTTVLASAGRAADAEQLKTLDPRFGVITDNDGFSPDVDLHVIVGADFSD